MKKIKRGDKMKIYFILTSILLLLDILCAVSIIFIEKRDSTTTWAWLLVLVIFPFRNLVVHHKDVVSQPVQEIND